MFEYMRTKRNPNVALVMRNPRGYRAMLSTPTTHFYGYYRSTRDGAAGVLYYKLRAYAGMSLQEIRKIKGVRKNA